MLFRGIISLALLGLFLLIVHLLWLALMLLAALVIGGCRLWLLTRDTCSTLLLLLDHVLLDLFVRLLGLLLDVLGQGRLGLTCLCTLSLLLARRHVLLLLTLVTFLICLPLVVAGVFRVRLVLVWFFFLRGY